jgi:hypothetical protein
MVSDASVLSKKNIGTDPAVLTNCDMALGKALLPDWNKNVRKSMIGIINMNVLTEKAVFSNSNQPSTDNRAVVIEENISPNKQFSLSLLCERKTISCFESLPNIHPFSKMIPMKTKNRRE